MLAMRRTLVLCFGCIAALFLAVCIKPCLNLPQHNKYLKPGFQCGPYIIGIDLGLSYSRVGVVRKDIFEIISDKQGHSVIPAYVSFPDYGEPLVGFKAKTQASSNPKNTVYDIRRLVGRNFSDPEVQEAIKELPYEVIGQNGQIKIKIHTNGEDKAVTPEEVSAMILQHLQLLTYNLLMKDSKLFKYLSITTLLTPRFCLQKIIAEEYLNSTISHAVITVPCSFIEKQRQATKYAGIMGGLEAIRMLNKPASVGTAHHLDIKNYVGRQKNQKGIYIVYDMGDKEPELSLVSIDHGVFEVLGTVRDKSSHQNDFKMSKIEQQSILSPNRIIELVKQLLSEPKLEMNEVDDIVLSGNPSHMIEAQRVLESYFGKKALAPIGFSNDQAVVYGAAIQGYNFLREQQIDGCAGLYWDVTPLHLGIKTSTGGFAKVIPQNYVFPIRRSIIVSTTEDNQESVTIRVLEGARETALGNRELGTLELAGLPHKPKGVLEIEVCFEVDANEVLTVSAGWKGRSGVEKLVVGAREYTKDELESLVASSELPAENEVQRGNGRLVAVKDGVNVYNPPKKGMRTYFPWKDTK
ncbi:glucose-regulated 78 of hsp70 family protein [Rutstroemia sp. NJR-2017a WRK4]|nr:glucose-regulated 78 of hsp70 family protein [Rutstroemia sp. NJR-2017a WRK4]